MCAIDYVSQQQPRPKVTWMAIWSLAIPCFLSVLWALVLGEQYHLGGSGFAGGVWLVVLCFFLKLFIYLGAPLAIYLGILTVAAAYHGRPGTGGRKMAYSGMAFSAVVLIGFIFFQHNSSLPFLPLLGT